MTDELHAAKLLADRQPVEVAGDLEGARQGWNSLLAWHARLKRAGTWPSDDAIGPEPGFATGAWLYQCLGRVVPHPPPTLIFALLDVCEEKGITLASDDTMLSAARMWAEDPTVTPAGATA